MLEHPEKHQFHDDPPKRNWGMTQHGSAGERHNERGSSSVGTAETYLATSAQKPETRNSKPLSSAVRAQTPLLPESRTSADVRGRPVCWRPALGKPDPRRVRSP